MSKLDLHLGDCMEAINDMEDNEFDLAIVDPVFGDDSIQGGYTSGKGGGIASQKNYHKELWSQKKTDSNYFKELFRISKNQIIWGGNYFSSFLPSSMGWIFWNKRNGEVSFSDGELAFTSFSCKLRMYTHLWSGMLKKKTSDDDKRIHPTQKPVALYKWLLKNYAKEGDTILDTHLGSMSIAIACYDLGFDLTGYEIDEDYYKAGIKRVEQHKAQGQLFQPEVEHPIQTSIEYKH